jgi:hypothetical protein
MKPLQLVHNDVCNPFKHPIHNGACYFVTVLDNYSKRILMVIIKTNNQVFVEFKRFKRMAETIIGQKLQIL